MLRRERRVIGALVSRAHSGNAVLRPHPALDCGLRLSNTGDWAAPFEKHHVTPPAIHAANPLPRSHNSKPGLPAQGETRGVLRKDAPLKRPDPRALGRLHDRREKRHPDILPAGARRHINTDLRDTGIHGSAENRAQRGPSDDLVAASRSETGRQLIPVPHFPLRRGVARGKALEIDSAHGSPILRRQRSDLEGIGR